MGTKWKKWVSFGAFALGITALAVAAVLAFQLSYRYSPSDLADAFHSNYQDSRRFRALMEEQLHHFISGAADHALQADYDADLRDDEDLLYLVVKEDEVLWSNATDYDLPARVEDLPNYMPIGYNFALYFDGRNALLSGDPAATDPDKWSLPGRDWEAPASAASTRVWLCAATDPVWGTIKNHVTSQLDPCRRSVIAALTALALGLAFLAYYLFHRREKAEADRAVAAKTGLVWFECKLLVLLFGLVLFWPDFYGYFPGSGLSYAVVGLWCVYLFVNDCRYVPKPWTNSACTKLSTLWRDSETGLTLQKRMARRGTVAVAGTLPLALLALQPLLRATSFSLSYPIWLWVLLPLAVSAAILALLYLPLLRYVKGAARFAAEVDRLAGRIAALRAGDLSAPALPEDADLLAAAADLSAIGEGMAAALDERIKSERMKVELIANVSHDLKTPLTSILSYADLLKQEEDLPPHVRDYIRILDEKAHRLSAMVQDVFEVSKAASGALPVKREELDLGKLIDQTLADMAEDIEHSGLTFKVDLPPSPVLLTTDGDRLYRVFQNLFQNALSYSLPGSRVYVTLRQTPGGAVAAVKNTSRDELPSGVDFTERFVRGDPSRTDGGSGLGLAIASSFATACGASLSIETDADLFTVLVEF